MTSDSRCRNGSLLAPEGCAGSGSTTGDTTAFPGWARSRPAIRLRDGRGPGHRTGAAAWCRLGQVEARGVGVRYGRTAPWVLQQVSLALPAGALVEVTGRNGSGKSSLLRTLAGVLRPAAGSVRGRPDIVGWAPERFPSAQPFTAGAYLRAQARVRGLDARAAEQAVERESHRLHLVELLGTALPELSRGSAQKVGLAQALLVPPGLLVLDEPWSGLDADAHEAVPGLIREVLGDGGRVIVTDHQQQAAALSPDQRWHVEAGAVDVRDLTPQDSQGGRSVVVEVEVADQDAPALLAALRARGLAPRVR